MSALSYIQHYFPQLLLQPLEVIFTLHIQHFIELVRNNQYIPALHYAQGTISPMAAKSKSWNSQLEVTHDSARKISMIKSTVNTILIIIQTVMALIAYKNPFKSPLAEYLSQQHRDIIADKLNDAILGQCDSLMEFRCIHLFY